MSNTAEILNFMPKDEKTRVKADLTGGFSQVAWDLTRELRQIKYHFSPRETALIWALIDRLYGPEKHESLQLDDGDLAELTGMPRQKVQATRVELLRRRILFFAEDGSLGINRSVSEWQAKEHHGKAPAKPSAPKLVQSTKNGAEGAPEPVQEAAPELVLSDAPNLVQTINNINEDIKNREKDSTPDSSESGSEEEPPFYLTKRKRKLTGKRLETFNRFWGAFSFRHGKAEAADAWLNIPELTNRLVEKIIYAAEQESFRRADLIANGRSPKWAEGWINGRRWEDDPIPTAFTPEQQQLVDLFNEHVANGTAQRLPPVDEFSVARATLIQAQLLERPDMGWWEEFFQHINDNCINLPPKAIGFDWLMKRDNLIKVMEGNYE